jgi:radical SAM additional 4Fe4S-binding domain
MKLSSYTFFLNMDKEYYVYNTFSNALIEIDKESYFLLYNTKKKNDWSKNDFGEELYEALVANSILTDSNEDDYLKYKAIISSMRKHEGYMHLTLAPTMDCCFNCHYCFEKYKDKNYMTPEVMDSIVKYIASLKNVEGFKLTWFGGEPLMALPQMEAFYEKLVQVWKKDISSDIITTGYHINEEAIRVLKKTGVSHMQITLDGLRETHNKIKYLPNGEDTFSKVWSNIELINDLAPNINIIIRVNLTRENAHEYIPLFKLCHEKFGNRKGIGIAPAFVLDRGASNCNDCDKENLLFGHADRSEFILDLAKQGIGSQYLKYPEPFFYECAIRNNVAISFDPEGYAYKCWEVIGNKEYAIGRLNSDGLLADVNLKVLNRQLHGADPMDDPACMKCKYLPICCGGCPIQTIQNKFEDGHNNVCTYHKGYLEDFLKIHLRMKQLQEENA